MFDFKLTDTGDLDIGAEPKTNPLKISFVLSEYPAQRIKFMYMPMEPLFKKEAPLRIQFRYNDVYEAYEYFENNVEGIEEAVQAVRIAMRTEKNDTYDLQTGSELYKRLHKRTTKTDLAELQDYVQSIVDEFIPDTTVTAALVESEEANYFRYQSVQIKIKQPDKVLATFIV